MSPLLQDQPRRRLGPFSVSPIGLGCMNLSHAYGVPPAPEKAEELLLTALELGVDHFDTAALYGFGSNESLVGRVLSPHRSRFTLASKCGMTGVDGKRVIDGRPETLKRTCDEALGRLRTDVIDLYYLHRWDKTVPIEDSVGALADLVAAGKIRAIGLSEVSAATLRRAHAVHPVAAIQSEYSLWSREADIAVLEACRELGIAFVAFSPLARGYLTGKLTSVLDLDPKDIRRAMPRFAPPAYAHNLTLLAGVKELASRKGCSPAQLALAWCLHRSPAIVPIPGTTDAGHLRENLGAAAVRLSAAEMGRMEALVNRATVVGERYPLQTLPEIDTEMFEA